MGIENYTKVNNGTNVNADYTNNQSTTALTSNDADISFKTNTSEAEIKRKNQLCQKLGITLEELEKFEKLYTDPKFCDMSLEEQREIVEADAINKKNIASGSQVKAKLTIKFPDNWQQMSAEEKQNFILDQLGRAKYSDWDQKTSVKKEALINEEIENLCAYLEPKYKALTDKDKGKAKNLAKVVISVLIDNIDVEKIESGGIEIDPVAIYRNLRKQDPKKLQENISAKAKELGIVIDENHLNLKNDIQAAREYFNIKENEHITPKQILEYYEVLISEGKELTQFQKDEYKILNDIKQIDPSQLESSDSFNDSATTTIEKEFSLKGMTYIKRDDGSLAVGSDTNCQNIMKGVNAKFGNTKDFKDDSVELKNAQKEFAEIYYGLSYKERRLLLLTLLKDPNFDRRLFAIVKNESATFVVAANSEDATQDAKKEALNIHNENLKIRKENGEEIDVKGYTDYVAKAEHFDSEVKAVAGLGMAQLGEEETDAFLQSEKEYDENYMETFKYTNKYINDSDDVTDAMKEFYASRSIEILDDPAERAAQASDLYSYESESYNKGIETGYANIAQRESINYNEELAYIQNGATVQQNDNIATTAKINEILQNLSGSDKEEFVKKYNLPPSICEEHPELVSYYVNKGDGMYIVENCSVPIGNTAIQLMLKNPEDRKKLAALQPGRLSKFTYDLVHQNDENSSKKSMPTYKA